MVMSGPTAKKCMATDTGYAAATSPSFVLKGEVTDGEEGLDDHRVRQGWLHQVLFQENGKLRLDIDDERKSVRKVVRDWVIG